MRGGKERGRETTKDYLTGMGGDDGKTKITEILNV